MTSEVRKKLAERTKKPNGPFVHYSPPRVIPLNPSQIRQWVRGGEVERLELIVLEGQGKRLLEEHSVEPRTRNFLKTVPDMMARCEALHEAVKRGSLGELLVLIDDEVAKKKFVLCKDEAGVGLLHKAVFYDFQDIVKWLITNYPQTIHQRDSQGRTALHYACVCQDAAAVASVLEAAGALRGARDACGRTPAQYARSRIPPTLPTMPAVPAARQFNGSGIGKDAPTVLERSVGNMPREGVNQPAVGERGLVIKPSNIRIWCHDRDLGRLQRVVWQGHGARLLSEVSSQSVVKRFLEAVPYIMNTIREVHAAAGRGDAHALRSLTADPVPPVLLSAKDANGLTAAHKAAGLGNIEALDYIANRWPEGLDATDNEDRTPLHYAASLRGDRAAYEALIRLGAQEGKLDSKQRTASYYLNRPMELDRSWLTVAPDAPRTPSVAYPISWDWRLLEVESVPEQPRRSRKTKNSADGLPKSKTTDAITDVSATKISAVMHKSKTQEHIKELVEDTDALTTLKTLGGNLVEDKKSESKGLQNGIDKETPFIPLTELNGACDDDHQNSAKTRNDNTEPVVNTDSVEVKKDETELGNEVQAQKDQAMEEESTKEQPTEKEIINEQAAQEQHDKKVSTEESEDNEKLYEIENRSNDNDGAQEVIAPVAEDVKSQGNINKHNNHDDIEEEQNIRENEKILHDPNIDESKAVEKEHRETDLMDTSQVTAEGADENDTNKISANIENETQISGPQNKEDPDHIIVKDEVIGETVEVVKDDADKTNVKAIEGIKKSENDNDDDDVQVPGSDSEYGDSNLRSTAEALNSGSVKRGNIGPNTQESLIEGVVHEEGEEELDSGLQRDIDDGENEDVLILDNGAGDDEVDHLIKTTNMELLAALVLNGEGKRLMGKHSKNSELQAFLDNVPTYMNKIKRVHSAAREGNLRDLQAALDRRKFAIARDPLSPNGATPLHVAVIFGKTNIIKYLGGRFPETLSAVDFEGRTALHYAAAIPDNGHYYNLLQQLGANSKDLDDNGQSAEDFVADRSLLSLKQLLLDFGVDQKMADEMLTDKVPDDRVSSRRDLDDADQLATLERCYRLLQESRAPTTAPPGATRGPPTTYLGRFLKRNVFDKLKHRVTKLNHNLFDVIWPAVKKLPENKNIVQIVEEDFSGGISAPDYYVYAVFEEFLNPVLKDMHNMTAHADLNAHPETFFVPHSVKYRESDKDPMLLELNVDPGNQLVLLGTIECSRNLDAVELPINLSIGQLETVERVFTSIFMSDEFTKLSEDPESDQKGGSYYTLNEVLEKPSEISATLAANGLLIPLCDKDDIEDVERLHGKHWPYGRGVYVTDDKTVAAWINVQEHVRVLTSTSSEIPGEIGIPYSRLSAIMMHLHEKLIFRWDPKLGHLSCRPTFLGNSLRFNLTVELPNLTKEGENLKHLCFVRGLQYRATINANIVCISNYQSLGLNELQTFNDFTKASSNLIQLESNMTMQSTHHISEMLTNIFRRKKSSIVDDESLAAN